MFGARARPGAKMPVAFSAGLMHKRKMRALALVLILALSQISPAAVASERAGDFGLGVQLGTISSITGKYFFDERHAVDFGVGLVSGPWTVLYGDYLYHFPGLFGSGTPFARDLTGYVGGGAGVAFWHSRTYCRHWDCGVGASGSAVFFRGLFGAEWKPAKPRLGVFLELGPSFAITPNVNAALEAGLGVRYYF